MTRVFLAIQALAWCVHEWAEKRAIGLPLLRRARDAKTEAEFAVVADDLNCRGDQLSRMRFGGAAVMTLGKMEYAARRRVLNWN